MSARNDRRGRGKGRRKTRGHRPQREKILVLCQGTKTEPEYFNRFKQLYGLPHIKVQKEHLDPANLVDKAITLQKRGGNFAHIYVVVDVDDTSPTDLQRAAAQCRRQTASGPPLDLVVSNENFDYWLYAHVIDGRVPAITRKQIQKKLSDDCHLTGPNGKSLSPDFPVKSWTEAAGRVPQHGFGENGANPSTAVPEMLKRLAPPL
ncbi:RloB family protein [Corynebacterium glyciniphilum]|uniref:RloB family protein n=1 Tax=Corynebacterium glyciniphilum TaxID=1404244 RepID=UPI003DA11499